MILTAGLLQKGPSISGICGPGSMPSVIHLMWTQSWFLLGRESCSFDKGKLIVCSENVLYLTIRTAFELTYKQLLKLKYVFFFFYFYQKCVLKHLVCDY